MHLSFLSSDGALHVACLQRALVSLQQADLRAVPLPQTWTLPSHALEYSLGHVRSWGVGVAKPKTTARFGLLVVRAVASFWTSEYVCAKKLSKTARSSKTGQNVELATSRFHPYHQF